MASLNAAKNSTAQGQCFSPAATVIGSKVAFSTGAFKEAAPTVSRGALVPFQLTDDAEFSVRIRLKAGID